LVRSLLRTAVEAVVIPAFPSSPDPPLSVIRSAVDRAIAVIVNRFRRVFEVAYKGSVARRTR
jgi:hypothetical protein